jgi:hypothetical protein
MSTNQTYNQENDFKLQRNRLTDLIKRSDELIEKLETRMNELQSDDSKKEEVIYDLEV